MNRRCRRGLGAGRVTDGVEPEGPSAPARPVRLVPAPRPEAWIVEALGPLPQRIEELGPECRTSAAVDAVHDLRVATRRLREALRLFGPWLPGEETRRVRRRLRQITRGLGPVRDQDVALEFYTASRASGMAGWPGETDEAREWIARRCARERRAALPAMRRLIKRANCGRVRPEVEELLRALREARCSIRCRRRDSSRRPCSASASRRSVATAISCRGNREWSCRMAPGPNRCTGSESA